MLLVVPETLRDEEQTTEAIVLTSLTPMQRDRASVHHPPGHRSKQEAVTPKEHRSACVETNWLSERTGSALLLEKIGTRRAELRLDSRDIGYVIQQLCLEQITPILHLSIHTKARVNKRRTVFQACSLDIPVKLNCTRHQCPRF